MSEYGLVIFLAALAAIISFFSGIFAGVTFSGIFVRMIISSLIFAVLGFLIKILTKKYLPEFYDNSYLGNEVSENNTEEDSLTGNNINVVLPDENPHEQASSEKEEKTDIVQEEAEVTEAEPDNIENSESFNGDDFVEEISEIDEVETELETEAEPVNEDKKEVIKEENNNDAVVVEESAGNLPDLDSFSDTFAESSADSDNHEKGNDVSNFKSDAKLDLLGLEKDSGSMAKAVQTFLKKDQEGN